MADQPTNFRRADRVVRAISAPIVDWNNQPAHPDAIAAFAAGPCVIAANHRSVMDVVVGIRALSILGHTGRVLSAEWLWNDDRVGRLLDSIGAIPLRTGRAGLDTIDEAIACLAGGDHLFVTPEGRVVPEDERPEGVGQGHKIVSRIACGADVRVVPGALVGTENVWPIGASRPVVRPWGRPTITMRFGAPVDMDPGDHRGNTDRVMAALAAGIAELESPQPVAV